LSQVFIAPPIQPAFHDVHTFLVFDLLDTHQFCAQREERNGDSFS
jgi:hypothetical protein